jgi:two-component system LytT family response regulator
MIKCIIVEDEIAGQIILKKILKDKFPEINVLCVVDNVDEAVLQINDKKPDLVFMDVQIKGGTGFDVLKSIESSNIEIIFVTSYEEYAISAINENASYYLLKPISQNEFKIGVEKILERMKQHKILTSILVSSKGLQIPMSLDFIFFLESQGSYTYINSESEKFVSPKNLGYYEKTLPPKQFIRTHHSFLVNIQKVEKIIKGRSGTLIMKNGIEIPISQRRIGLLSQYFID